MSKLGFVCSIEGFKFNLIEYIFQGMKELSSRT